jgi:HAD superfamily hydrolase (TIGR01549 family)
MLSSASSVLCVTKEHLNVMPLVTIDFHNTLFQCDEWFRLEIETLPVAVFECLQGRGLVELPAEFDVDATTLYRRIRRRAMDSGIECDADTSVISVANALGLAVDTRTLTQTVAEVMWVATKSAEPVPGARELVQDLADERVPLIVVSSAAYHPFLEWCLQENEMRSNFEHVVTSASCGIYKSNPDIYRYAMDLANVDPNDAIHIGDSHRFDVTSAARTGMRTILFGDPEGPLEPAPDAIVRELGEAKRHLDRLLPGVETERT